MQHVGLVKSLASRLAQRVPSQVECRELISVGVLGLIDAAGRYKPSLGVPFDAFARRRIHGAMLDALRELDWAPRSLRKMRRDVDGDDRAAAARARPRASRSDEIAAALNVSATGVRPAARPAAQRSTSPSSASANGERRRGAELEVAIDPAEGPHARLERARAARAARPGDRSSCRSASGRSWRSTTKRSSRWPRSAR